uniref:Epoxide hydrolase n=1 Tax=Moniliophthora roreri TaxID=221103 RepID=A0A0W0G429_MONRR
MQALGYEEYVTQGGDWGSIITRVMASEYGGKHVKAWHTNMPVAGPPPNDDPSKYDAEDLKALERSKWFQNKGMGYFKQQSTQPQTIGYNLADSPQETLASTQYYGNFVHVSFGKYADVPPEGLASPHIAAGKSYDQLAEISRVRHVVKFYMYDTTVTDTVSPDLSSILPSLPTDITKSLNRLSWFWMSLGEAEVLVDPSSVKEAMDFRHQDVTTEIPWYEDLHGIYTRVLGWGR